MRNILVLVVVSAISLAHPATIADIKKEYYSIERSIKDHDYNIAKKSYEHDNIGTDVTIYRDKHSAVIRKLIVETGSEDSYHKAEYSYTDKGVLFFTYNIDNNVAGCSTAIRSYYNKSTLLKRISKIEKCDISYRATCKFQ